MFHAVGCILLLASLAVVARAFDLDTFLREIPIDSKSDSITDIGLKVLTTIRTKAESYLKDHPEAKPSEYAYWNFIPMWRASIIPDKASTFGSTRFSGTCFPKHSVAAHTQKDGNIRLSIETEGPGASESCYDHFIIATVTGLRRLKVDSEGLTSMEWKLPTDMKDSEKWDLSQKGIRVMEVITDTATSVANLLETVLLFIPEFTHNVDPKSAARNVDFLAKYAHMVMEPRDPLTAGGPPPAHEVHSGDFFGVIRLDGLDPMLAWGMGSTTGHTTVALWIEDELYICESTATSSYWDVNGIQKTPYYTWLKKAEEAGYNVVHAPLNKQIRAHFNVDAAIEFFRSVEGLDYGYMNMLWGWLDTLYNNYPCVPDDFASVCLSWELVEPLFASIDRVIPQISDQMWNAAWNKRIGTEGLGTADIYYTATQERGLDTRSIPMLVEQDAWVYNTTRYEQPAQGKSMVCCVFVCNVWKAAGVFGDMEFNCAEMTNFDDYSLALFEEKYEQIMGRYTLELNGYNAKTPYAHMKESCASLAPDYAQNEHC